MINVAVVGAGGMGKTHLNNFAKMDSVKIVAVCDCNESTAALAEHYHAAFYTDLGEMLCNTKIHVVVVCTPTFLHYAQVKQVLEAGIPCISEKPLCLKYEDAQKLYDIAREKKTQLYVAHVLHFFEEYQILAKLIKEKTLGNVQDAFFFRLSERPKWTANNWLFCKEKSGLIPFDLHIHDMELIISLFGEPETVTRQNATACEQNEHYRLLYQYPMLTLCAEASWYDAPIPFEYGYRVYFEHGLLTSQNGETILYQSGNSTPVVMNMPVDDEETAINVKTSIPYQKEMEHFIECVKKGIPSDIVEENNVLSTIKLLNKITACENSL